MEQDKFSRIRDRDWVFQSLWTACGDRRVPKCSMNIPVTVIFRDGMPFKAVETDPASGFIERLDLDHDRFAERNLGELGFQGSGDRTLRALRKVLIDVGTRNGHFEAQSSSDEPLMAKIWYVDGESESISLRTFDILMRNSSWRTQVLLVQSYVPYVTETEGFFATKSRIRSKLTKDGSEAADKLAKVLAKYSEKAYSMDGTGGRQTNVVNTSVAVREIQAVFFLDGKGKLYFSHTIYLLVEIQGGRRELEEAMLNERRAREATAAQEASAELVKLILHAEHRGLSVADSFAHFDEKKTGFVDVDALINGLAKLGIGLTYPVGESLLQIIGGVGSFFVSLSDFELYIKRNSASELIDDKKESPPRQKNRVTAEEEALRKTGAQLRLPHQRIAAVRAALTSRTVLVDTSTVDLSGFDDLPAAPSAYKVDAPPTVSSELPPWATARQKEALREIKRAQKKRNIEGAKMTRSIEDHSAVNKRLRVSGSHDGELKRISTATSPSSKSGKDFGPSSGRTKLDLQGIAADSSALVAAKLQAEKDEVLHIDGGVTMTFRVVMGAGRTDLKKTSEAVDSLKYRNKLEESEKILIAATEELASNAGGGDGTTLSDEVLRTENGSASSDPDRWLAFTLVIIPDVFMSLETLHKSFEPLIVKYPLSRLLLVGPPGCPYTHWPRGWILNADMQSRSILSLLLHLKQNDRVGSPRDPIFMMGFGTGGYTMSRFTSLLLPALPWMQSRLKAVVLVNGFIHMYKGFKRVIKDLRSALLLAQPTEVAELVSSLHFSDDYISKHERYSCMESFWNSRRGLCSLTQSDVTQSQIQPGKAYTGVLEQLRGLLIGPDALSPQESFLASTRIPLFVVQATDDVFVNPTETSIRFSKKNVEAASRVLVEGLLEGLVPGSVHVSWIKCGHEILIERPAFLLALISNFIQEIKSIPEELGREAADYNYRDDIDPVELARMRREAAARDRERIARELELERLAAEEKLKRQQEEQDEIRRQELQFERELRKQQEDLAREALEKEAAAVAQQELESKRLKEKEELNLKNAKKERDKMSRAELMAERKRREEKEARKAELQELYEAQRLFKEQKAEAYETSRMILEDERSSDLRVYVAECEAAEVSARSAMEKVQDLFNLRREDALKKIEEKLALERAERLEKRRRDAQESVKKIELEEAIFMDTSKYKLLNVPDEFDEEETESGEREREVPSLDLSRHAVADCIAQTHDIFRDYLTARQRLIEAMKRQRLIEEKTMLFRTQKDELEADIRKLQRALRLFVKGTLAAELGATERELDELKQTLSDKESTLTEFTSIGRDKESHLESANRSVQQLKVSVSALEEIFSKQLSAIQGLERQLSNRARKIKFEKENELIVRDKQRASRDIVQRRLDVVKNEYTRVKAFKEEYVDSDVLFDGVLQRCVTKTLRKHLKLERSKYEERVKDIENNILSSEVRIEEINARQVTCRQDLDKLSNAIRYFYRGIKNAQSRSVVEEVSDAIALQEGAASNQARRDAETLNMSRAELVEAINGKVTSGLASKTRKKPLDLRTKEDRKFIGMDMILHPEEYLDVNITEAEEMQFDPDYQCDLKKSDLERIEKLPELIALAIPFLHSKSEVMAHRLVNKYYRDKDDAYFEQKDFLSYGVVDSLSDNSSVASVGSKAYSDAEVIHDILIKEFRRDRIRAMAGDVLEEEKLTYEEVEWLQLDKILSPHVYEPSERAQLVSNKRFRNDTVLEPEVRDPHDLVNSIVPLKSTLKSRGQSAPKLLKDGQENDRSGDRFEEIRWRFENGEIIFEAPWTCVASREQLLEIRVTVDESTMSEHDVHCKRLMEKYYVDDNESLLGQDRLSKLKVVSGPIAKQISKAEAIANEHQKDMLNRSESVLADQALEDEIAANRKWGSWEEVHPASAGILSQRSYFIKAVYDPSRDHPASVAVHPEEDYFDEDSLGDSEHLNKSPSFSGMDARKIGRKTLLSLPGDDKPVTIFKNDPNSQWFICDSVAELARQEHRKTRGKAILIASPEPLVLLEVSDLTLQARQSRSHRFDIPDHGDSRVLEICVSIIFQGTFSEKGYRFGRVAAGLFRLPETSNSNAAEPPRPVGVAPYDLQSPNTPDSLGRIVIVHKPQMRPIRPGSFQIVIGCAAYSKYSIHVACKYAKSALPVVDELIATAKIQQARLPLCLKEMDDLVVGLRLAERKLSLCGQMIREIEADSHRCEKAMQGVHEMLVKDDEMMTMTEDERKEHTKELAILEVEFAQNTATYTSRNVEMDYIKEGIKLMHDLQRERTKEKKKLKEDIEIARRDLPACIALLRSVPEAANVAIQLNTTLEGKLTDPALTGAAAAASREELRISTPADRIRRLYRSEGYKILSLEEKQFLVLDKAMAPHKYEWEVEQLEEENLRRQEQGKRPKKPRKYDAAVEAFRYSRLDIERILAQPFASLSRQEMNVRKLLSKYHDNPEIVKRGMETQAHGFDPHRAERTRIKMSKAMSQEELQWMSIDKILHPEVWAYYTHEEVGSPFATGETDSGSATLEEGLSRQVSATRDSRDDQDKSIVTSGGISIDSKASREGEKTGGIYGGKGASGAKAKYGAAGEQQNTLNRLGKFLGVDDNQLRNEQHLAAGDLTAMVRDMKDKKKKREGLGWRCPFKKQKILQIWRSNGKLETEDEKHVFRLLLKYNGTYYSYSQTMAESKRRAENHTKMGSHVRWEVHGLPAASDIDQRAREVLLELDKAMANKNFWMDSRVLHNKDQRFPTAMVRLQLEDELDAILRGQIQERERADRMGKPGDESDDDSADDDIAVREAEASSDSDLEAGTAEKLIAEVKRRAARREKRRMRRKKEDQKQQVHKARKMILLANKSGDALEEATLQNELGHSGCLACRSPTCNWKPTCDEEVLKVRIRTIVSELERIRSDLDAEIFVSEVAIGAQLGGGNVYRRTDLVEELTNEQRELERRIHLNQIDKELHDCFRTRKEYIEVKYLHGYSTVLWTNNARKALSARQSRLVALNTAHEVIDEILDWMLDGWYFGERESTTAVMGYVPSIKKDGMMRAGQDQISAAPAALEKVKARVEAKKKGILTSTSMRGRRSEKLAPIVLSAELKNLENKVAKVGSDHWHMLNETEATLRFGLFLLTFMYFRAMAFLGREKRSWSGADDAVGGSSVSGSKEGTLPGTSIRVTEERRKMLDEEHKISNRKKKMDQIMARARVGEARKKMREDNEKREAALKLQEIVRRQKLELASVGMIQRVYRGHIGRKAASRWILKRAEMNALNMIMNAAATCLQRIWRGYLARVLAVETRAEMAYFIALMRAEESQLDEEEYWKTHALARYKRGARGFFNSKFRNENQYKILGAPPPGEEVVESSSDGEDNNDNNASDEEEEEKEENHDA